MFKIVHDESVKVHLPMYNGNVQQNPPCVESCVTKNFSMLLLLYSSHEPIGPQPYPVIYVVANPVRGHKELPRSTGHIMVTTRYSDKQGSKSRQKVMRLYKRWHRPITKRFIKPPLLHIESSLDRLGLLSPTHDQRSQQQIEQLRSNQFDQQFIPSFSRSHIVQK